MIVTLGSVAVGAILALVTTRANVALGGLRTFAVAGVVTAVLVHLLPEAVQELGLPALLAFGGALVLPQLVARLARARRPAISARGVGADLGFYGFALHQWAEGLALGTFVGPGHEGHGHGELVLAMAAHTVPLTAVFVVATLASRGRRSALYRTGTLLVATTLGFVAAGTISQSAIAEILPWLSAFVAGFLCHILLHDEGLSVRRGSVAGLLDVVGALAGIALPWLASGISVHEGHALQSGIRGALGEAFLQLVALTAPALLVGLVLAAGLQLASLRFVPRYAVNGGSLRQALRGIALGAPRPLCACGALPLAEALRKRGVGAAVVMAFLLAVPGLGIETFALTVAFFGPSFALLRLGAVLVLAVVVAVVFARVVATRGRSGPEPARDDAPHAHHAEGVTTEGFGTALRYFDELLLHTAPWTLVVLVVAAFVEVAMPRTALAGLADSGADILVIALVALPAYVSAAATAPLAAVLLMGGVSPGAVLVGLLLGPVTNLATIEFLQRGYGRWATGVGVGMLLALGVGLAMLLNGLGFEGATPRPLVSVAEPGWFAYAASAVLVLMLLRQLWRWGLHPWFEILDAGGHGHGHEHEHEHGHDGDHRHHHGHDHQHIPGLPGLLLPDAAHGSALGAGTDVKS